MNNQANNCQKWRLKWGNGVRNIDGPIEECDDGNNFNYDGWDQSCKFERGFICSGGSATTIDTWIENKFMPIATLLVLTNNNLIIKFNDTITNINPTDDDLYIVIYGPLTSYEFTWTASFQDSSTLLVKMDISSEITGSGEKIYVEFPYSNNLWSIYSLRQTSPEISLSGTLNEIK